ncbi:Ribonuclease J [uncultured archaeon]|nr:Ribonuclease J [uncultured archaeon]
MSSLTFFGGINEIGGNKILLEQNNSKIFLDFGQSFSLLDDFFLQESYLSPRERFGLKDYFEFNLMPKLPGLYSKEALEHTNLAYQEPECDGIFITHAHMDHVAHLKYLHPNIPIYMGETTKKILESTAETTRQKFWTDESEIKTFRTNKEMQIGEFNITPVHVDHSVPGAYGFIIETKEGNIAYSGDLRSHGRKPQLTKDFIKKAQSSDPKLLIIEGTRVAENETRKNHTEPYVYEQSKKVAQSTQGLILAMRYPKDLDRFMTFYQIAKETGKKLVISLKTAHLVQTLKQDEGLQMPDPFHNEHIQVYERKLTKYPAWQKEYLDKCIEAADVRQNQEDVLLELDFYYLNELVDIQPQMGACIHSMSEPFEEDPVSQMGEKVLFQWLNHFKLAHHQLHASGHASKEEIFQMIEEIDAKKVAPVHTHHPELFPRHLKIEKGQKIEI